MANSNASFHIVIVGAGLGGLAAACCLARHGHNVELYERRDSFNPAGGGMMLRSGASRFIYEWGLADSFEAISEQTSATVYRSSVTNEVVFRRTQGSYSAYPDWGLTRKDAQTALYDHAISAGARFHFGKPVIAVSDDTDSAMVTLDSGIIVKADLVLIADGVLSRLRPMVLGEQGTSHELILGAHTGHQIQLSGNEMLETPETAQLMQSNDLNGWVGDNKYAVSRWSSKMNTFNCAFFINVEHDANLRLWDEVGDIDQVRESFHDWPPALTTILKIAKSCDRWRIAETPNYGKWISEHGRLALLGDSAHGMLPDVAQGFSQIIEDIGILDILLADSRISNVASATRVWQDIRKPRVERIKAFARANHQNYTKNGTSLPKNAATQAEVKEVDAQPDSHAPFNSPAFNKWTLDYDGKVEVEKFLGQPT